MKGKVRKWPERLLYVVFYTVNTVMTFIIYLLALGMVDEQGALRATLIGIMMWFGWIAVGAMALGVGMFFLGKEE